MRTTTGTRKVNYRNHTGNCSWCGDQFTYLRGNGTPRKYCTVRCREEIKKANMRARTAAKPNCRVEGCTRKGTRVSTGYCEVHFYRVRRNGTIDLLPTSGRAVQSAGYHLHKIPGHPLARRDGWVYTHRQVAHDKHDGVCPGCYWCGKEVDWRTCHVDHLDDDKDNNEADNLEVACPSCNKTRGLLVAMFKRVKPERRDQLMKGNTVHPSEQ